MRFRDLISKVIGTPREGSPFKVYHRAVIVIIGGIINWALIYLLTIRFADTAFYYFPLISSVTPPLPSSRALTRYVSKNRIVPPSHIQVVTFASFILTFFLWQLSQIIVIGVALVYSIFIFYQFEATFVHNNHSFYKPRIRIARIVFLLGSFAIPTY